MSKVTYVMILNIKVKTKKICLAFQFAKKKVRDLYLGHAARGGRDARKIEGAELVVVAGPRPLALEDGDGHGGLAVCKRFVGSNSTFVMFSK
jgi:hypothetical protein